MNVSNAHSTPVNDQISHVGECFPIKELPDELLFKVMSKLDDMGRYRDVCKKFNQIFCQNISTAQKSTPFPNEKFYKLLSYESFTSLQKLV